MASIGQQLAALGWTGVSGYATGADQAWLQFVPVEQQQVWLPWWGYNDAKHGDPRFQTTGIHSAIVDVARDHYLAGDWNKLKTGAQLLFIRNVAIMAGDELEVGVDMCLYWQSEKNEGSVFGGTNHAVRVAKTAGIPCFNIRKEEDQQAMAALVDSLS
jgi:hypothetical protein